MLAAVVRPLMQEVEGRAHNNREEKLERCHSAVWGHFEYSGAIVIVRLGPRNGKTVCNEEVCGKIQMQR